MRLPHAIFVLAFVLGAAALWASDLTEDWVLTGTWVGAGLALIAVAWTLHAWWRNRQRRRLMRMRDSALW